MPSKTTIKEAKHFSFKKVSADDIRNAYEAVCSGQKDVRFIVEIHGVADLIVKFGTPLRTRYIQYIEHKAHHRLKYCCNIDYSLYYHKEDNPLLGEKECVYRQGCFVYYPDEAGNEFEEYAKALNDEIENIIKNKFDYVSELQSLYEDSKIENLWIDYQKSTIPKQMYRRIKLEQLIIKYKHDYFQAEELYNWLVKRNYIKKFEIEKL